MQGYPWAPSAKDGSPFGNPNSNNRSLAEATQGIHSFNQAVASNPNLFVTILPIRDGISIIRRK